MGAAGSDDPEAEQKGLFSLPFMKRAMEKRKQEAQDEAQEVSPPLCSPSSGQKDPFQPVVHAATAHAQNVAIQDQLQLGVCEFCRCLCERCCWTYGMCSVGV